MLHASSPGHRYRPNAWVGALMLIVGSMGCAVRTHPPAEALPGRLTNAGRLEAMFSIHAHYFWPNGRFPAGVRPIPLRDATKYLAADESRAGWSRRRRAIAELAAVGLHRKKFRDAIRDFGVDPGRIESELDVLAHKTRLTVFQRETIVADLESVAGKPIDCASQWNELKVSVSPPSSPTASYLVEIHVPAPADTLAGSLDAQTWDNCSKFFCPPEQTFLAHLDSNGNVVTEPAVPAGSAYKGKSLYEQFTCPLKECGYTQFRNILNVDSYFKGPPHHYQLTYTLQKYLSGSSSGGFGQQDLELFIDNGQLWAEPEQSGPGSVVHGDKTVWFRNPVVLGIYNGGLQLMQKELAGELAETACCVITSTPPTKCPP